MAPGLPVSGSSDIYAATYSNVPVYEFNVDGNHVMRRRYDNYINATHILKVADYDKPARTRILEREVQKGLHEKIQGGYGKYQGTWIPLEAGRLLAERNNVLGKLRPIFDYVHGDVSPPPAPKHTTNSNRARAPKTTAKKLPTGPRFSQMSDDYETMSVQIDEEDSQDAETVASGILGDGDDGYGANYMPGSSRKRKRRHDMAEQQHMIYADALLDYFIISSTEGPTLRPVIAPPMPPTFEVNRPIDDQWHTALHWAVAMGDVEIVRQLVARNANALARNQRGETPLIRAVLFTNNYEKTSMQQVVKMLGQTIGECDHHGASIIHHIVMTTNSRARRKCAQYYLNIVLDEAKHLWRGESSSLSKMLDIQDRDGDTALHIAARHNAKKCYRALREHGARDDIANRKGELASRLLASMDTLQETVLTSSPPMTAHAHINGDDHGLKGTISATAGNAYHSEPARSFSQSFDAMLQEKSMQVALALDDEMREKEELLEQSQQAHAKIEQERATIREQMGEAGKDLLGGGGSTLIGDDDIDPEILQLQAEYAVEQSLALSFSEQLQHRQLHRIIRESESSLPPSAHRLGSNQTHIEQIFQEQIAAARELAEQQDRRRNLTREVANARAEAGMGPNGEEFKSLVAQTMGVDLSEVNVELVDGLMEELEAGRISDVDELGRDIDTALPPVMV